MVSGSVRPRPRFFYGYIVVIAAFFVLLVAAGTMYSFGVFFKPMSADFGWTRAVTSGAYSLALFLFGLMSMLTGRLNDRFGPRRVVTVCGLITGLGYFLVSRIENQWQLYLFLGLVVPMGTSGSLIPMMSTVARWFVKKRGLMAGVAVAGVGVGQIVMPLISTQMIAAYSWRAGYIAVGIIGLVVLVVAAQFLRRDPARMGLAPDGEAVPENTGQVAEIAGFTRREAMRTRQFWMLILIYFCYEYIIQGTMVHLVPHATDLGISPVAAASILSVVGGISVIGRIGIGSAGDRIGNRRALMGAFALAILAFIWVQFATELWKLYAFAAVFALAYGGLIALESPTVASLFGLKAHGAILGMVHFGAIVGGAASPLLAGKVFDMTGSYQVPFVLIAMVCVLGLVMAALIRPPQKDAARLELANEVS